MLRHTDLKINTGSQTQCNPDTCPGNKTISSSQNICIRSDSLEAGLEPGSGVSVICWGSALQKKPFRDQSTWGRREMELGKDMNEGDIWPWPHAGVQWDWGWARKHKTTLQRSPSSK